MLQQTFAVGTKVVLDRESMPQLFAALTRHGYTIVGPTVRNGAIVYGELAEVEDLPIGWTDVQEGGSYRLVRRNDAALFGYAVGAHSWKEYLLPPVTRITRQKQPGDTGPTSTEPEAPAYAFIGVRACELRAIGIQDKIFMRGPYVEPIYKARRDNIFTVAVNCGEAGGTCFCVSMQTGPKVESGFDLSLTEILDTSVHYFLVEIGSERSAEVISDVSVSPAGNVEVTAADAVVAQTAQHMGRTVATTSLKDLLYKRYDDPQWEDVATRCMACANCTLVCPTCFCTTVKDTTPLMDEGGERLKMWDSCFTTAFSYIHGGSIRSSVKARYRQWLTHKFATWIDQFGESGCVGCGRCITWCPVGIDITAELRSLQASAEGGKDSGNV